CASEYNISREEQDAFAIQSYQRSQQALKDGKFTKEIVPVEIVDRKGNITLIDEDEEIQAVDFNKIPLLKSAFKKDGTVTAANASTLNDGAAALILISRSKMEELNLKPIARI